MKMKMLERIVAIAVVTLMVLVIAACTIHLRGDENQAPSAISMDQAPDPLATKLAGCRSATYEQKDALTECRKIWAEKRRQFTGQKAPSASSDKSTSQQGPSLFVPPKDESRLSPGYLSIPRSEKE